MACQSGPIGYGSYGTQISIEYQLECARRDRDNRLAAEAREAKKEARRRKVLRDIKRNPRPAIQLIRAQKRELDLLTRLLCGLLKKYPALSGNNKALSSWWIRHQAWDAREKKKKRRRT